MNQMDDLQDLYEELREAKKGLGGIVFSGAWKDLERFFLVQRAIACKMLESVKDFDRVKLLQNDICTLDLLLQLPKDLRETRQEAPPDEG